MGISVEVRNLGPLKSARIALDAFNVLVGRNNTGKTFLATVLHRVLASSYDFELPNRKFPDEVPEQFRDLVEHVIRLFNAGDPESITTTVTPNSSTRDWINAVNTEMLTRFGGAVRNALAYAYGTDPASLRRKAMTRNAPDSYLFVRSDNAETAMSWSVKVRFDSDAVEVETPGASAWLARILRDDNVEYATGYRPLRPEHTDDAVAGLRLTCRRLAFAEGRAALFDLWPREAIHLPSERTGIVQNLGLLTSASVRGYAGANGRSARGVPPTGTTADLISLLADRRDIPSKSPEFAVLAHEFEERIGAGIEFEAKDESARRIDAVTPEGRFPISRASAMLCELAALVYVLRHRLQPGDCLTIDEPEAHMHPEAQRQLASFLVQVVNAGATLILTTHSDFFVAQVNNHIRAKELHDRGLPAESGPVPTLHRSQVRALWFTRGEHGCVAQEIDIDPIDGIDEGTFSGTMRELNNESAQTLNPLLAASDE